MKVTKTGMTTVIAQAYAAYKRSGPVEEAKATMAGGMVLGDQSANSWNLSGQDQQKPKPNETSPPAAATKSTSMAPGLSNPLVKKGGTDIIV